MSGNRPPKPDLTSYAVVDGQGHLVESASHLARMQQDPASTTKLWTLYTILTGMKNGSIDKNFLVTHGDDAERMMVRSDNNAARRLAIAAGGSVEAFTATMTQLAHQKGMRDTHFNAPNGELQRGNYSTAADIALALYHFEADFPKRINWLKGRHYSGARENGCPHGHGGDDQCLNTGKAMIGQHDIAGGKTGTGNSEFVNPDGSKGYGGEGRFAFAGFTNHSRGAFAVLGADTPDERNARAFAAADALNNLPQRQAVPQRQAYPIRIEFADVDRHGSAPHTPTIVEWALAHLPKFR